MHLYHILDKFEYQSHWVKVKCVKTPIIPNVYFYIHDCVTILRFLAGLVVGCSPERKRLDMLEFDSVEARNLLRLLIRPKVSLYSLKLVKISKSKLNTKIRKLTSCSFFTECFQ